MAGSVADQGGASKKRTCLLRIFNAVFSLYYDNLQVIELKLVHSDFVAVRLLPSEVISVVRCDAGQMKVTVWLQTTAWYFAAHPMSCWQRSATCFPRKIRMAVGISKMSGLNKMPLLLFASVPENHDQIAGKPARNVWLLATQLIIYRNYDPRQKHKYYVYGKPKPNRNGI